MPQRLTFRIPVHRRFPFSAGKVPLCVWPYRLAHNPSIVSKIKVFGKAVAAPVDFLWKSMLRIGANCKGHFVFTDQQDKKHLIHYRAGNTQFHSIYSDARIKSCEPEVSILIDILASRSSVFYDIGANWGYHSLYLASKPQFDGKIFAFEPVPKTFGDLCSVVEQAGLIERIHCIETALSNQSGARHISFPDSISSGMAQLSDSTRGLLVNVKALDDLNLPHPDVIKLDAEGEEANILRGGWKTLSSSKPMIIFESFRDVKTPKQALERFKILEELGYTFFQPAFILPQDDSSYAVQVYDSIDGHSNWSLGLYEFSAEERLLISGVNNFLACHKDRINDLL
jgi:FkbM family methyltransferase